MPEFNYIAYLLFSSAVQFTPGPNNIMLSVSGMNFGYRRTLPFIWAILIGVPSLALMMGFGTEWVIRHLPNFQGYLMMLSICLLLWIAYRIAVMPPPSDVKEARPIRFIEALLFQVINPKAWAMILSSIGLFVTAPEPERTHQLYVLVVIIGVLSFFSASTWVLGGMVIRRLLTKTIHFRIFNVTCALTLVGCAIWVAMQELAKGSFS